MPQDIDYYIRKTNIICREIYKKERQWWIIRRRRVKKNCRENDKATPMTLLKSQCLCINTIKDTPLFLPHSFLNYFSCNKFYDFSFYMFLVNCGSALTNGKIVIFEVIVCKL